MDEQLHAAGLMLAAAAVRASFIVLSMSQLYAFCGQCVVAYRNVHLSASAASVRAELGLHLV